MKVHPSVVQVAREWKGKWTPSSRRPGLALPSPAGAMLLMFPLCVAGEFPFRHTQTTGATVFPLASTERGAGYLFLSPVDIHDHTGRNLQGLSGVSDWRAPQHNTLSRRDLL